MPVLSGGENGKTNSVVSMTTGVAKHTHSELDSKQAKWKALSRVWLSATPWTVHGILQARILEYPGVGSFSLLQGIFPTQESNPGLRGGFFTSWATREVQEHWRG